MSVDRSRVTVRDFIEFYHFYNSFVQYIIKMLDDGVPKVYFAILLVLEKYGPLPISHIGDKLGITKSNMTPVIDGMEEKGFITRQASASDRRIVNIVVAPEGAKYIVEAIARLDELLNGTNGKFSDTDALKAVDAANLLLDLGKRFLKACNLESLI